MKLILNVVILSALVVQVLCGVNGVWTSVRSYCYYKEVLSCGHVVKDDGVIDLFEFIQALQVIKNNLNYDIDEIELEAFEMVLVKCKDHKHPSGNKCDTADLIFACVKYVATELGYNPVQMQDFLFTPCIAIRKHAEERSR